MNIIFFLLLSLLNQKGYGLTVFKGEEIDTFKVEIIGMLEKALPRRDIILAKIWGGEIDKAGVIAGMSGSPVYINGKLIGAVAYNIGGAFSKEPICGITPIKDMIEEKRGTTEPSYKKLPVIITNLPEKVYPEIKKFLKGFDVISATGGIKPKKWLPAPGKPIGVLLMCGDLILGAIGTCTHREGKKVWGFGHGFIELHETNLPMTGGYIQKTVPSDYYSYKIGEFGEIIGTVKRDSPCGIFGIIGEKPKMCKCKIKINGINYCYEIPGEKRLITPLSRIAIAATLNMENSVIGERTLEYSLKIKTKEKEWKTQNIFTGNYDEIIKDITSNIDLIAENPFKEEEIEEIEIKMKSIKEKRICEIEDIVVNKEKIEGGDTIKGSVIVHLYGGIIKKYDFEFVVPDDIKNITISAEAGKDIRQTLLGTISYYEELEKIFGRLPKNDEIVIKVRFEDKKLPPSKYEIFEVEREVIIKKIDTGYFVQGRAEKSIGEDSLW